MKRILVPVDFSTHTNISCRYALQIAVASGAEIILFHSFFDQFYYSDGGMSTGFESGILMTDEIILDFYKQKEKKLHELAAALNSSLSEVKSAGVNISCLMESGNPEVQILSAIGQLSPDLIIMGSGGMGKKGLMAGSVARRIIDHTEIPVIAIPEQGKLPEIKNVAYMTTFDPDDIKVIANIEALLAPFSVKIFFLHLSQSDPDPEAQQNMDRLRENQALKTFEGRISFHLSAYYRDKEYLQNFMSENQISLIAFIPHKRNIFKNLFYQGITREDLFQTSIPIMAVRPVQ